MAKKQTKTIKTVKHTPSDIQLAAKTLMIIATCFMGILIIPLAWCLPMTISYSRKIESGEKIHPALGICAIIFMGTFGIAAGVCSLIDLNNK